MVSMITKQNKTLTCDFNLSVESRGSLYRNVMLDVKLRGSLLILRIYILIIKISPSGLHLSPQFKNLILYTISIKSKEISADLLDLF